ncbi:hypothetical protein D9758_002243 [Tetrapyrgos nigripes]|uniref:F-box domain-containing protein n=1 Tax=Tetrapyrgos nigripes TaxID=182062 RepID=A0A8H5GP82_9AGAR|nr:hypothetical protein D9758_002243 [Tetrapyrgos nigripes]
MQPTVPLRPSPYDRTVHDRIHTVLGSWEPHVLTQDEIQDIRCDCERRRQLITNLESQRNDVPLDLRAEFYRQLFNARLDHDVRYFRLFRINDLPMEILSNILRFIVWSAPEPPMGILWRLELTWVCSRWRNAAIGDPTLWSAIWFRDQPPFTRSLAFVQRAKRSPLDLRISDSPTKVYTYDEIQNLLEHLTPSISNIRMLIVLLHSWDCVLALLSWLNRWGSESVPMIMERLEIHRTGDPRAWPGHGLRIEPHPVTLFPLFGGKHLPSLNYVTLNSVHCDWNKSAFRDLTTLDIRRIPLELCPTLARFRDILSACSRLEKLSLDGAGPSDKPNLYHGKDPIVLNSLRTFVLANFTLVFIHSIITHISAPFVRDLTIMNFVNQDYTPFYYHITGQFREVRLLTLYNVQCYEQGIDCFIKCLDSFPHLRYLRMANLGPSVLSLFLYDPDKKTPHPKLSAEMIEKFGMRINSHPPHSDVDPVCEESSTDASLSASNSRSSSESPAFTSPEQTFPHPSPPDPSTSTSNDASSSSESTTLATSKSKSTSDSSSPVRIMCPKLNIIEVQCMEPELFTLWVEARMQIGTPVVRIYMTPEMFHALRSAEMFERCKTVIRDIFIVRLGTKTPEEDALLRDDSL